MNLRAAWGLGVRGSLCCETADGSARGPEGRGAVYQTKRKATLPSNPNPPPPPAAPYCVSAGCCLGYGAP